MFSQSQIKSYWKFFYWKFNLSIFEFQKKKILKRILHTQMSSLKFVLNVKSSCVIFFDSKSELDQLRRKKN